MIYHQPGNSLGNYNYNTYYYSGKEYAPHFHKNLELICVLSGCISVTVNGKYYAVACDHWVLITANQIHSFQVPADAKIWVAVFSQDHVPAFVSALKNQQGVSAVFKPDSSVRTLVMDQLMQNPGSLLMRKSCFYAACDNYLNQTELEQKQEKASFLVGQLLDWIAEHYTENISLMQAAELFGYEYHYLSRLLNKNYAISFTALLSGYRVEHALQLLMHTDLPITEIASRSGFQSIRSFNLSFKKLTGVAPNEYRRPIDKTSIVM